MINLSDIVSPDGEDPARWRVRVDGHAGTGIMCGMLFTDGVCAEPARDTQARKILAAIGVGVVIEPWDTPEPAAPRMVCGADFLPAELVARLRATMERYPDQAERFAELFEAHAAPVEMPSDEDVAELIVDLGNALDELDGLTSALSTSTPPSDEPVVAVGGDEPVCALGMPQSAHLPSGDMSGCADEAPVEDADATPDTNASDDAPEPVVESADTSTPAPATKPKKKHGR